jgi:hypothetical protein
MGLIIMSSMVIEVVISLFDYYRMDTFAGHVHGMDMSHVPQTMRLQFYMIPLRLQLWRTIHEGI